jgi:hypothetical protein
MWWPCLQTDRDEMSHLHRGHSIDASYQVSVVAMFINRSGFSSENPKPNELKLGRKNLWKVFSKECTFCYDPLPNMAATMSKLHREHSIDDYYQVLVLAMFVN